MPLSGQVEHWDPSFFSPRFSFPLTSWFSYGNRLKQNTDRPDCVSRPLHSFECTGKLSHTIIFSFSPFYSFRWVSWVYIVSNLPEDDIPIKVTAFVPLSPLHHQATTPEVGCDGCICAPVSCLPFLFRPRVNNNSFDILADTSSSYSLLNLSIVKNLPLFPSAVKLPLGSLCKFLWNLCHFHLAQISHRKTLCLCYSRYISSHFRS